MPIAYSCPHCGKGFTVADQYAGQTGPCAACGQKITIPMGDAYGPQPPSKGTSGASIAGIVVAMVVVLVICSGIPLALLLPAVQAAREAARRTQASNNLKQIGIALHNYHDVHKAFPPAVVTDANGQPLYSGRVLLLPYLEEEGLYKSFDLTQAWNSPRNMPISQASVKVFIDPSAPANRSPGQTDYLFVSGKGTVFESGQKVDMSKISDGLSNTIVVMEVRASGAAWAEPKDIDLSQPMPLPPGNHPGVNMVLFGDGSVRALSNATPAVQVQAAATRAGGEPVMLP